MERAAARVRWPRGLAVSRGSGRRVAIHQGGLRAESTPRPSWPPAGGDDRVYTSANTVTALWVSQTSLLTAVLAGTRRPDVLRSRTKQRYYTGRPVEVTLFCEQLRRYGCRRLA